MTAPPAQPSRLDESFALYPDLREALAGIDRAADSEAPILLLGEPGSGRGHLARQVHGASPRAGGPLVTVEAGAIPVSLFEAELFGHRAGAFTGAESDAPGRVARAEGGTLLLDQLEELPATVQPKLLRLIAERRYSPLGGGERAADLRFLGVGSVDLPQRVDAGAFRADLYYRLEVFAFLVPPLRSRPRDFGPLVRDLLGELAQRQGRETLEIAAASLAWMRDHPWPGNIRQLRNLIERALILHREGPLVVTAPAEASETPRTLAEVEAEHIRRVLRHTRGHQGKAARVLGISRKNLWEKRKRYGIP